MHIILEHDPMRRLLKAQRRQPVLLREIPRLHVKSGAQVDPATIKTGFADMAIVSWRLFDRLGRRAAHDGR